MAAHANGDWQRGEELGALTAKEAETPGAVSEGERSLGQESFTSGCSGSSGRVLLQRGKREKDVYIDAHAELEEDHDCQIGKYSFPCLRPCLNVKVFVFCMCLLLVVSTAVSTGYLNSVITTIEKRFEIGSSVSGMIAASYELGSLISVIFVSYLGSNRHIPKWIGIGVLVQAFGSLLFALPHVIAPKYTLQSGMSANSSDENICRVPGSEGGGGNCGIDSDQSGNWGYVLLLISAQVLIGTGGTPVLTLGITYVDNHVAKEKSPAYLAFIHASGALGPVLGYALGALLLQYYVDSFTHQVIINPGHPQWIGAWWGGFIICGLLLFLLAFPFLGYPRVLVQAKRRLLEQKTKEQLMTEEPEHVNTHYGKSIKEIPRAILKLLKNPVYALLLPAISCEIAIVSGFVVFLPKYIETQFGTSTSVANLFTGGIGIPGAVIGILIGGYLLKRFQLKPKGALQFVLGLNFLAVMGFVIFFFMGCDNQRIAGATLPYFNSSGHKIFEANLTSQCNQNCDCSPNHLEPICGINGITYFSPCHAGCTVASDLTQPGESRFLNYSGCSCIMDQPSVQGSHEVIISPLATSGPCKSQCERLLPFLIMLVVMTFCVAGTQMPLLMVTLRCVGKEEKAFALGLQYVVMRLFAYVPAPIYFGNAIDSACLLWSRRCESHGSCLVYDIEQFRFRYIGVGASLKVVSVFFFVLLWFIVRRKQMDEEMEQSTPDTQLGTGGEVYCSLVSLDRVGYSPTMQRRPSTLRLHPPTPTDTPGGADVSQVLLQPPEGGDAGHTAL
ncbi:solute carrier organic anion transporter family member 5A1-like [Littorina saxatilis]|uniref:Solute carrier organic anion transporter family member n=1 Tax=Littorina saxatilis TaxID=31220 RepID=A0AAN9AQX1_9CAEN